MQGATDIPATRMGQETAKDLLAQKIVSPTDSTERVLEQVRIAEDLSIDFEGDTAHVVVQNCFICPLRVGGYDLEGFTACTVGGFVRGAVTTISGKTPRLNKIDLKTGEIYKADFSTSSAR